MKKILLFCLLLAPAMSVLSGCSEEEKIVIFTPMEQERLELLKEKIADSEYSDMFEFEEMGSGDVAKDLALNNHTRADIVLGLPYSMYGDVEDKLLTLDSSVEASDYADYIKGEVTDKMRPISVYHSSIISRTDKGLSDEDINSYSSIAQGTSKFIMPNPNHSGTGSLIISGFDALMSNEETKINGYDTTLNYMKALNGNIHESGYTTSGSHPLKFVADNTNDINIGFGMHFLSEIEAEKSGSNLKVTIAEEGAPWAFEFNAIVDKDGRKEDLQEIFDWLLKTNIVTDSTLMPTPVLKSQVEEALKEENANTKAAKYYNIKRIAGTTKDMGTIERREEILKLFADTIA